MATSREANLNLSSYRTSADLEHVRHFTGLPRVGPSSAPEQADGAVSQIGGRQKKA